MRDTRVPVTEEAGLNVWHRPPAPGSPTVLLIHGLTGTSRWWIPVISHLPKSLGLVAPDVRGRGASSALPGPYGIRTMADDMKAVLDHLGIVDAVVAGYSMGAWIGAVLGNHYPSVVERMVMIDGGLPFPVDETLTEDEILHAVIGPSLQRLSARFPTQTGLLRLLPGTSRIHRVVALRAGERPRLRASGDRWWAGGGCQRGCCG